MRILRSRDALSGVVLVLLGGAFAVTSLQFDLGSAVRPGPGYFSFGLGVMLVMLGLALVGVGLRATPKAAAVVAAEAGAPMAWRPLCHIVAAILLFALALPHLGLWITFPLTVVLAARGSAEFRWREAALNSVVLTIASWAIFVWGLKLQLPLWPQWPATTEAAALAAATAPAVTSTAP